MIINSERLEMFRDLKIQKSEIFDDTVDLIDLKSDTGQPVQIWPANIIELLKMYKSKEITEEHLLEWVNTVWFTELFEYCDECSDCIEDIMNSLEETGETGNELDDRKIESYIKILSDVVVSAATKKLKYESKATIKDYVLSIIVGLQTLLAAILIVLYLICVVGINSAVLLSPFYIHTLFLYIFLLFFGINFFREKQYAWYGEVSIFLSNVYIILFGFLSLCIIMLFKDSFINLYKMPLPEFRMNSNIIVMIIWFCFSLFVLKLLFRDNTLDMLNIKTRSKLHLLLTTSGIAIVASILYFGIGVLLYRYL